MNPRFEAAWELHIFLTEHNIPYAIIGGTALPRWGEPRFTKDVNLVAMASLEEGTESFARLVLDHFHSRTPDPMTLVRLARMILIQASNGCEVDISLGMPGYEDQVIHRSVDYELEPGKIVRVCSAEDLIIHKCVAGRPQDERDVESVILRQGHALDVEYIRKWLSILADLKPDPEILERFERAWRAVRRAAPKKEREFVKRTNPKK